MADHLRLAGRSAEAQTDALIRIVRACPPLMSAFRAAREIDLPDWWIVSGAIYNQVWNHLTQRPHMTGVNDIDLFYFDPDPSWEAEDRIIKRANAAFDVGWPVQPRNQARVHIWYQARFGEAYAPLQSSAEALENFACKTHAVGMRLLKDGNFRITAPFGLDDIFAFRVTPHTRRNNRATHEAKAARQIAIWPELTIVPWPENS